MTKEEIKHYLLLYHEIKDTLGEDVQEVEIKQYGRKKRLKIVPWINRLRRCIEEIIAHEKDILAVKMIRENVVYGKKDKDVMKKLPVSESTYYRWKRKLVDKIYDWYISEGGSNERGNFIRSDIGIRDDKVNGIV